MTNMAATAEVARQRRRRHTKVRSNIAQCHAGRGRRAHHWDVAEKSGRMFEVRGRAWHRERQLPGVGLGAWRIISNDTRNRHHTRALRTRKWGKINEFSKVVQQPESLANADNKEFNVPCESAPVREHLHGFTQPVRAELLSDRLWLRPSDHPTGTIDKRADHAQRFKDICTPGPNSSSVERKRPRSRREQ